MSDVKCVIGTNSWGSKMYERVIRGSYVDDAVIEEAVKRAVSHNLTVFDTADDYGFGYAQKLLGKLNDDKTLQISAKFTPIGTYKEGQVHRALDRQLKNLKASYVDYYWLHLPNDIEQNLSEMVELYHEGKIRHIGVSNFNLKEAKQAKDYLEAHRASLYGVQNHFSLLDREEEGNGMLDWCHENHIAFWGWAVLEEGILSGHTKSTFALLFHRRLKKLTGLYQVMEEIGEKHHLTLAQVAVVYCISKGVIPICGCRRIEHADQLAEDTELTFDQSEIARLEKAADLSHVNILKTNIFRFAVKKPQNNKDPQVWKIAGIALLGIISVLIFESRQKKNK